MDSPRRRRAGEGTRARDERWVDSAAAATRTFRGDERTRSRPAPFARYEEYEEVIEEYSVHSDGQSGVFEEYEEFEEVSEDAAPFTVPDVAEPASPQPRPAGVSAIQEKLAAMRAKMRTTTAAASMPRVPSERSLASSEPEAPPSSEPAASSQAPTLEAALAATRARVRSTRASLRASMREISPLSAPRAGTELRGAFEMHFRRGLKTWQTRRGPRAERVFLNTSSEIRTELRGALLLCSWHLVGISDR